MNLLKKDDGAALISVLLLVAVMSAAMVASFDLLGFYTRGVTANAQIAQANEYALAGEFVGARQARELSEKGSLAKIVGVSVNENQITIPIANGEVNGLLRDRSNCFNLNSVIQVNNGDRYEINQIGYEQFIRLLKTIGIGERSAVSLSASLVDWQDSDSRPIQGGAEDYNYSLLDLPYQTANVPLMDIDELRLINGFTPDLIDAIKPFVCIDPISMKTNINLNSITNDKALLMQALLGQSLSAQDMTAIISQRPEFGYDNVARFWDHSFFQGKNIHSNIRSQFSLKSDKYEIVVDVKMSDIRVQLNSIITLNNDGTYHVINRKFGA